MAGACEESIPQTPARRYILFILTIYARKFKPHIKVAVFWRESWASQISTDD